MSIVYKVSAKKVQNYLSGLWRVIRILKKTDFLFEKWNKEFGEF